MKQEWRYIVPFLAVGAIGFFLNMALLTLGLMAGTKVEMALLLGIAASTLCNFLFDRHLVFSYARHQPIFSQFMGFGLVCLLGATFNFLSALSLLKIFPTLLPQVAEWGGILVGTSFNYVLLRNVIFRN